MTPFRRQSQPDFWDAKEQRWVALDPAFGGRDPLHDWQHENVSLGRWFHQLVRPPGEPHLCAYCDGLLTEQSRETIDHHLPRHAFPALALSWWNLFPACDRCNSEYKKARWSCRLVRPDTAPVEAYFDLDEETGWLRPSAKLDWSTRVDVRLTIHVFRLNDRARCEGRRRVLREMANAWKRDRRTLERDEGTLEERALRGPYRFVARRFLDSVPPSAPSPGGA